jgi:hypothetical protein
MARLGIIPKDCMSFELVLGNDFLRRVVVVMNGGTVWMQPKNEVWMQPKNEVWLSRLNCFPCCVDVVDCDGDQSVK